MPFSRNQEEIQILKAAEKRMRGVSDLAELCGALRRAGDRLVPLSAESLSIYFRDFDFGFTTFFAEAGLAFLAAGLPVGFFF
jgi:hypothetical protein